jgi:lipoprotein-anchoring transpeptidase ErfK/SrfK
MLMGSLVLTVAAAGAAAGLVPYRGSEDPAEGSTKADAIESEDASDDPAAALIPSVPAPSEVTPSVPMRSEEPPSAATDPADSIQGDEIPGPRHDQPTALEHGDQSTAPPHSGHGRRVVYDMSDQRVWLVGADGSVRRSYLVSGSVYDNLDPGSYRVYSRSRHAVAFDQLSTMDFMVRFTEGDNAPIGFHDIPENVNGDPVQSIRQLGTPHSHGCIRQRAADAKAMWDFADIDTAVRVLA